MDEIGRRYLLLALRLGRHLPDLVSSYAGPAELAEVVAGEEPAPPEELHVEALWFHEQVQGPAYSTVGDEQRLAWLADQLLAMSHLARLVAGEEIALVDLVRGLYGMAFEPEPEATFTTAHHQLEEALPRGGPLAARLAAHEETVTIPPKAVLRALRRAVSELRRRTIAEVWVPDGEALQLVEVADRRQVASSSYLGGLQSRVEIDPQWPMTLGGAVELAAGEAYPGRHAERVTKEALLLVERERGEAAVTCRFTPEQAVSDGLADVARGVALTDLELDGVFHRLVRDLNLTIPAAAVGREVLVARARSLLGRATANAALMLGSDGVPEDEVRAWLAETSLMDARFVDQALREISTLPGRIAAFSHMAGPRVIAEWLEVQGQTHGLTRLLAEQLTPWRMSLEIQAPAG